MEDLRRLSEITTRYGNRDINELEFATPEDFKKYKAKHKMRPGTVVKVAGKDKVVGDKPKDKTPVKVGDKKSKVNTKELRKDFKEKTKEYDDAQQMHTALDDDLYDYDDYDNISDKKLRDSISYDLGRLQDKLYTVSDTDAKFKDLEDVYVEFETLKKQVNDVLDRQTKPKDEPKKAKRKSVQLDFTQAKNQAELERMVKKAGLDVKGVDVDINPNGDLTAKVTGDEETLRKFMTSDEYGMDAEDVDDYMDEYGEDAEDDESETESKPYSARDEIDDAIDQGDGDTAMELFQSEVGFKKMGKDGKEAKKLLDRLADYEYGLIDLDDEEQDDIKDRLKQLSKKHIKESKISKLRELSRITTRYNK